MKRKWLLRLGLVAILGAACFTFFLWWAIPSHGINRWSARRIQKGMTADEVAALIGVPEGDYATDVDWPNGSAPQMSKAEHERCLRDLENYIAECLKVPHKAHRRVAQWCTDSGGITIFVDADKKVVWAGSVFTETAFDKLKRWLHFD